MDLEVLISFHGLDHLFKPLSRKRNYDTIGLLNWLTVMRRGANWGRFTIDIMKGKCSVYCLCPL